MELLWVAGGTSVTLLLGAAMVYWAIQEARDRERPQVRASQETAQADVTGHATAAGLTATPPPDPTKPSE